METPHESSAEEKLTRVLDAQIAGGFRGYERLLSIRGTLRVADRLVYFRATAANGIVADYCRSLLDLLLDPQGLRAAYDSDSSTGGGVRSLQQGGDGGTGGVLRSRVAARAILDAWLASDGNPAAAISTACGLLPTH